MVNKQLHPDSRLFDYLNGAADDEAARSIEAHLAICDGCASVAGIVRRLKQSASESNHEGQSQFSPFNFPEHPDISELASLFYAGTRAAARPSTASHLALCASCREAIAQYARGEKAAAEYKPALSGGEVPARAWEMIRDWEESSFANLKPAGEALGQELLTRLAGILNERSQEAEGLGRETDNARTADASRVPVLVVTRSGEVRSVEFFERAVDSAGTSVLRHAEGSSRFDNKPVHALFDFGEEDSFVVSNLIRRDTIRIEQPRSEEEFHRADYIIVED